MPGLIVATHSPGHPETLWHYTNLICALGIIESQTLWTRDTRRMADTTEFAYPRGVLVRVIERMDEASDSSYERWILAIAKIIAEADMGPTVYAACTSEARDQESQWEHFADRRKGFAIGLDRNVLYASAAAQGFSLNRMIYDVAAQESHYERAFRDMQPIRDAEEDMGRGPGLALLLGIAFSYPLTFVKNPQYVTEGEWRLMWMDTHLPDLPEPKPCGPDMLDKEVSLDNPLTGECSITEVVAGPAASSESIEQVRAALDRQGLGHVPITLSQLS